jgi:hypothetical protein
MTNPILAMQMQALQLQMMQAQSLGMGGGMRATMPAMPGGGQTMGGASMIPSMPMSWQEPPPALPAIPPSRARLRDWLLSIGMADHYPSFLRQVRQRCTQDRPEPHC